jgi:hypothetical protein
MRDEFLFRVIIYHIYFVQIYFVIIKYIRTRFSDIDLSYTCNIFTNECSRAGLANSISRNYCIGDVSSILPIAIAIVLVRG